MKKTRSTKRALLLSALALITCVSMLVGSTFAWFTDSVTSAGNKIQAGTLKLDLEMLENGTWKSIKEDKDAIFDYDLWEPGYTEVKLLKVENEGSLALKWVAKFTAQKALSKLAEVIDVYVLPSETELAMPADRDLTGYTKVGTLDNFINSISETTFGALEAGDEAYLGIALKMQESAGNEYQGLDLGGEFDITIFATQYTSEVDSFDDQYDVNAKFDAVYEESATFAPNDSAVEIKVYNDEGYKVASFVVPAGAKADEDTEIKVQVIPGAANENVVVAAGKEAKGFEVKVLGLKEGNTTPVKAELRIPAGLDPATVELYHYGTKIVDASYNPNTGYVSFESTDFSPFTVVYDAESEYVAPEVPPVVEGVKPEGLPVAIVTEYTETDNIQWGNYGQWSPTEGLEANLEAAYKFTCKESADEAVLNAYANWYCDFYVSLDKDLGENQLFLGGNYGSFGWVGFHNGDVTLEANTEIGLLESVTTNPWTYYDVANYVGTFICGVGDVDDALADATFTVKLRLTNPEDSSEYYDIETINYTFTKVVNSGSEIQDAINNGNTNLELGGDIDLNEGWPFN